VPPFSTMAISGLHLASVHHHSPITHSATRAHHQSYGPNPKCAGSLHSPSPKCAGSLQCTAHFCAYIMYIPLVEHSTQNLCSSSRDTWYLYTTKYLHLYQSISFENTYSLPNMPLECTVYTKAPADKKETHPCRDLQPPIMTGVQQM
jgi:hypothetical protein